MKKFWSILFLILLMSSSWAEQELNEADPRIQKLYAYSKAQADILLSLVTHEHFGEGIFVDYMFAFDKEFDKMKDTSPIRACFIKKTGTCEYPPVFDYSELYAVSPSSLCFNSIKLANDNLSLPSISSIAEYSANYGLITDIDGLPDVLYLLLMYGDGLPQIVTAFFEVEENTYITKTSLVYSSGYELMGSINLAIPMIADTVWNGIDRFSWNP